MSIKKWLWRIFEVTGLPEALSAYKLFEEMEKESKKSSKKDTDETFLGSIGRSLTKKANNLAINVRKINGRADKGKGARG